MNKTMLHIGAATLLTILASTATRAEPPKLPVPAVDQSAVALRGYFYVGGQYVGKPGESTMQGQVYRCRVTSMGAQNRPRIGRD